MPTRETSLRRGTERGRTLVNQLCREAETARVERGTSFAEVGRAMRIGGAEVARICRGRSPAVSVIRLAQLFAVLGLDLSARGFPAGPRLRDAAQLRLLERLRGRLAPGLAWRIEVPVAELGMAGSVDYRAWDAGIDGPGFSIRVDAETHVGDLQAIVRRVALKQRDSNVDAVILLLARTRHHRALLELAGPDLASRFPVPQRRALAALALGRGPGGNTLVIL